MSAILHPRTSSKPVLVVVVSLGSFINDEALLINAMFECGLDIYHLRKHEASAEQINGFMQQIAPAYRDKIAVHQCHNHPIPSGVKRLHYPSGARPPRDALRRSPYIVSTSCHSMNEYQHLESGWSYAFISPIFPSISKPGYGTDSRIDLPFPAEQSNGIKRIALGGLKKENLEKLVGCGADGVAFRGAVWQAPDPVAYLGSCISSLTHLTRCDA